MACVGPRSIGRESLADHRTATCRDRTTRGRSRRAFCRPRLDWSERRRHLAGRVGASIAGLAFEGEWIRRRSQGRSVEITGDASQHSENYSAYEFDFGAKFGYPLKAWI